MIILNDFLLGEIIKIRVNKILYKMLLKLQLIFVKNVFIEL